jgi:hypothetical protein
MKAVITLGSLVIDTAHLDLVEALLEHCERQDYDYSGGKATYYIRPMPSEEIRINLLPKDLYETQKLVWKLKQEKETT